MSKYKVTTDKAPDVEVDAWKFEVVNGVAMFYDDSGEVVAVFVGFTSIRKVKD